MHGILPYRGHTKALSELYMREASTAPQQHSNWVRNGPVWDTAIPHCPCAGLAREGVVPDAASARGMWRGFQNFPLLLPAVCDAVNRKVD